MTKRFFGGSRVCASICFFLGSTLLSSNIQAYFNDNSPLGTNTNEVLEYDSSVPFIDLFKASLPFREAAPHLTKGRVDYDRYGWPTYIAPGGMAGTRLLNKLHEKAIPRGYYTVLYEGQGKLEYGLDAKLVESQPGRDIIILDPGKDKEYSVKLTIKSTQPGNHLRNIRVLPQGGICASNPFQRVSNATQCRRNDYLTFERHYKKIIFNPDYLKFMSDYKVVRFMNMSGITRNPIRHWRDRPLIDNATWGGAEGVRGAPIEIMVELANRLHADPWFTIPHGVDDDYVRRFAQYVNKHLSNDLKVYLEYSNETWNGIFSQHAYMKQGGKRLGLNDPPHVAGWKFYSKRAVEMFKIWGQVFHGDQRLIRVLAGLTGTTEMTETMLKYENAYQHVDAFAVAPYVFGDYKALRRARSVAQVFQIMQDKRYYHSLPRVLESVRKQSAMTSKYGVDLIAYEGGQHLIDDKTKKEMQHPNPLFYKANRHPQMGVIYKRLLDGWKQAGGKMFVHFSSPRKYNRFGSKGIKEYITQPDSTAPKQMAVKNFIRSNPCWWQGCRGSNGKPTKPPARTTTQLTQQTRDTAPPLPNTSEDGRVPTAQPLQTAQPARQQNPTQTVPQAQPMLTEQQRAALIRRQREAQQQAERQRLAQQRAQQLQAQQQASLAQQQRQQNARNNAMYDIPELDSDFRNNDPALYPPAPSYQTNQQQNIYQNIPELEPIAAAPTQKYQPILIALNRPPREQYVFGTKAVANYERNGNYPLNNASTYQLRQIVSGQIDGSQDLAAIWQASWDERNFYLRIAVRDDIFQRDSRYSWEDDSIEIFIDADASKQQQYDQYNDFHMLYRWRDRRLILGANSQNIGAAHQSQHVNGRYVLDLRIPWIMMRVRPRPGHRLGIDIHVNDDDNGQGREGKLTWFGRVDEAYRNPSVLGELVLR